MSKNVLIIDDDEVILQLIRYTIEEIVTGEITSMKSSVDALAFVNSEARVDMYLVICDWQMPKHDGLAILDAMRSAQNSTPFLMVTAIPTREVVKMAKQKGASDFMAKPVRESELIDKVQRLLNI